MPQEDKVTLVLGASPNPERASYETIIALTLKGIPVFAVGKREGMAGKVKIHAGRPDPGVKIDTVTLYLNAINQEEYYDYILSLQPRRIIFNPGTINPEFEDMAAVNGIEVTEACTLVLLKRGIY